MTYAEYEAKIREIVANPSTLATASVDLLAEIKKDTETLESVHAQNSAHEARIRALQEDNYKLFLRATDAQADGAKPQAQESEKPFDDAIARMFGQGGEGE